MCLCVLSALARSDMSPMPSYNMDNVMDNSERLSPSPRETVYSPGEIISPRAFVKSPGGARESDAEAEKVVPVEHVENVINRVILDLRHTLNNLRETRGMPVSAPQERCITHADLENSLHMMKIQLITDIRFFLYTSSIDNNLSFLLSSEARSLTPIIAMSLTNLAITNEKKDDLFSYKQQVIVTWKGCIILYP